MKIGTWLYWLRWVLAVPAALIVAVCVSYIIHITLTLMLFMATSVFSERMEIIYYLSGPYVFLFVFHNMVLGFKLKLSKAMSGILIGAVFFTAIKAYFGNAQEISYLVVQIGAGIISIAMFNYLLGAGKISNLFKDKPSAS